MLHIVWVYVVAMSVGENVVRLHPMLSGLVSGFQLADSLALEGLYCQRSQGNLTPGFCGFRLPEDPALL